MPVVQKYDFQLECLPRAYGGTCRFTCADDAAVVELADTHDSKSCGLKAMSVRFRPAAPLVQANYVCRFFFGRVKCPKWKEGKIADRKVVFGIPVCE